MKSKIGEKENRAPIKNPKDFLKAYPGVAVLAGLVLVGCIGAAAAGLVPTQSQEDPGVLDNSPSQSQEQEPAKPADDKKPGSDDKKPSSSDDKKGDDKEGEDKKPDSSADDKKDDATGDDKKPDGSATTDDKKPDGSAATEDKKPDGSSTTDEKKPDGSSTTDEKKPDGTGTTDDKKPDEAVTTASITASTEDLKDKAAAHKKNVNSDTIGWLSIPNTDMSFPVVQASDNNYYIARDYNKQSSRDGVIYADYECDFSKGLATNNILYGHNWTNCWNPLRVASAQDKMFGQLPSFHYLDFAQKTPFIYFSTTSKDYVWQVFAAFYTEATFNYIDAYPGKNTFENVVKEAKARSLHNYNVSVSNGDKILTLSTCTRIWGNTSNQRFVVMAKLVPAGTSATTITAHTDYKRPNV